MEFRNFYEKYMTIIGPIGNMMFYIQAFKIFSTGVAQGVSFLGFSLGLLSMSSWIIYGFLMKNKPLILANSIGVSGAILVLIGTLIYS